MVSVVEVQATNFIEMQVAWSFSVQKRSTGHAKALMTDGETM